LKTLFWVEQATGLLRRALARRKCRRQVAAENGLVARSTHNFRQALRQFTALVMKRLSTESSPQPIEPTPFDDGALYDLFFERLDLGLDFYLGLARAADGPVLDVACGTKRRRWDSSLSCTRRAWPAFGSRAAMR